MSIWQSFSATTKFSTIAFGVTAALGLLSMGVLGALLYYPVQFVFNSEYGSLNDWSGDWVWPTTIAVGMFWSVGFILGNLAYVFLNRYLPSVLCYAAYGLLLWLWDLLLWYYFLSNKM